MRKKWYPLKWNESLKRLAHRWSCTASKSRVLCGLNAYEEQATCAKDSHSCGPAVFTSACRLFNVSVVEVLRTQTVVSAS